MYVLEEAVDHYIEIYENICAMKEVIGDILDISVDQSAVCFKYHDIDDILRENHDKIIHYILYNNAPDDVLCIMNDDEQKMFRLYKERVNVIKKCIRRLKSDMFNDEKFVYMHEHMKEYIRIIENELKILYKTHNEPYDIDDFCNYVKVDDQLFIREYNKRLYHKMAMIIKLRKYKRKHY